MSLVWHMLLLLAQNKGVYAACFTHRQFLVTDVRQGQTTHIW